MNKIRCRGKRVGNGGWVHGWYIKASGHWHNKGIHEDWIICHAIQNGGWFALGAKYPVIPETVGQYTGLKDKNGVEVCEGDVLVVDGYRFVILWDEERGGFLLDYWQFDERCDLSYFWPTSEVIGNIHDNPELMGRSEE